MFDVLGVPVLVNVIIFGKIEEKKTTPTNTCLNRKCMNPDSRCLSRAAYSVKNTYQNLHQESDIWISKKKNDHSKPKCPTLVKPSKVDGCCSAKKKRGADSAAKKFTCVSAYTASAKIQVAFFSGSGGDFFPHLYKKEPTTQFPQSHYPTFLLLMEEIPNNHLGCIKKTRK